MGTLFALYFPIERSINRVMIVTQGGEAHVRPDLSPWFVTGITAAVLLFAWNQFVGYLGGAAIGAAIGELSKTMSLSHANVGQAIRVGATVLSIPLCAVASIYAGMALNRSTRSGVVFALLLASIGYLGLNVFMTWIFQRDTIVEMLHETTDQQQMLGFAVGLALIAFVVFVFGAIGVIVSRVRRERSMGRLVSAARRLAPDDRDAVTEDVMNRLQGRAG